MIKGKIDLSYECQDGQIIESMKNQETYKYLGFIQSKRAEHKKIKKALKSEFLSRVKKLSKSKLNGKNLVKVYLERFTQTKSAGIAPLSPVSGN